MNHVTARRLPHLGRGFCSGLFWVLAVLTTAPFAVQAAQREFDMTIEEVKVTIAPGVDYKVFAFNGQVPGPLIHVQEDDDVTVHVTNNTSLPHTIHWHGIYQTNNWRNDGVPGITQKQQRALRSRHWLMISRIYVWNKKA